MLLQQIINGLTVGSTYALVAIGFSMVFGVLELTNLAHNSVFMLGAYVAAVSLIQQLPFGIAIIASVLVCGLFGVGIDRIALMPMRKRGAEKSSYLTYDWDLYIFTKSYYISFRKRVVTFPTSL